MHFSRIVPFQTFRHPYIHTSIHSMGQFQMLKCPAKFSPKIVFVAAEYKVHAYDHAINFARFILHDGIARLTNFESIRVGPELEIKRSEVSISEISWMMDYAFPDLVGYRPTLKVECGLVFDGVATFESRPHSPSAKFGRVFNLELDEIELVLASV